MDVTRQRVVRRQQTGSVHLVTHVRCSERKSVQTCARELLLPKPRSHARVLAEHTAARTDLSDRLHGCDTIGGELLRADSLTDGGQALQRNTLGIKAQRNHVGRDERTNPEDRAANNEIKPRTPKQTCATVKTACGTL